MRIIALSLALVGVTACTSTAPKAPRTTRVPAAHGHDHIAGGHRGGFDEQQVNAACEAIGWTDAITPAQQKIVDAQFANRAHRLQHALWHSVRGGLNNKDSQQVIQAFGQPWGTANPICPAPENNPTAGDYNPVGEDFLYMHHQMVLMLKVAFTAAGQKCVRGWDRVPEPKNWPVPDPSDRGAKSATALTRLQGWDAYITDPTSGPQWLRTVSLSQLGWALEFTIHNYLHMRYATARPPRAFRGKNSDFDGAQVPLNGIYPSAWIYDKPAYNWLADPYGAALNPHFWKIHGYVDHAIDLWLQANGKARISEDCRGAKDCYEWRGLWVGSLPAFEAKRKPAGKTDAAASASLDDGEQIAEFNRWRLRLQSLGVLPDIDPGKGPDDGYVVGAEPPISPLESAKAAISCP